WSGRAGVATVGELAAYDRAALLSQRNLGRTTVGALQRVLLQRFGVGLEELHAFVSRGDAPEGAPAREARSWDELRRWLPESVAAEPVSRAQLPTRLANYCAREGIDTLGAL